MTVVRATKRGETSGYGATRPFAAAIQPHSHLTWDMAQDPIFRTRIAGPIRVNSAPP